MQLSVRRAGPGDALGIAHVHRSAVHELARSHYTADVLEQWAGPVSRVAAERRYREAEENGAIHLVVELGEEIAGFGVIVPAGNQISACYVAPTAARQGIGSRLLAEMELLARTGGCDHLTLRASLNADGFYSAHGYLETGRGEHRFANGASMAAIFMRKDLV